MCLGRARQTFSSPPPRASDGGRNAVLDQRNDALPWQLRLKDEPAAKAASDRFRTSCEFSRRVGGQETSKGGTKMADL